MGPCTEPNMFDNHWVLADLQQSCTAACAAQGRTCVDGAAIPTTTECIDAISKLPQIDRPCDIYQVGAGIALPTIYNIDPLNNPAFPPPNPDVCYRLDPAQASTFTYNCDFASTSDSFQRLCPCTRRPLSIRLRCSRQRTRQRR